jgi:hypothetical protein
MQRPLNLVWPRQTLEAVLEGYFIKEVLLSEIGRPIRTIVVDANAPFPFLSDALVISFGIHLSGYLKEARSRGFHHLLHMADQHGAHDRRFYGFADYVLRHYWHERALVPRRDLDSEWLSYRGRSNLASNNADDGRTKADGLLFRRTKRPNAKRRTPANGQCHSSGQTSVPHQRVSQLWTRAWPVAYAAYLSMMRFGLVPGGNSPGTIRLYEVLEAGAIPVVI